MVSIMITTPSLRAGDDDDDDNHKNKVRGDACYVKKSRMPRSFNTNCT